MELGLAYDSAAGLLRPLLEINLMLIVEADTMRTRMLAGAYQGCVADSSGKPVDCTGGKASAEAEGRAGTQGCRHGGRRIRCKSPANADIVRDSRESTPS